MRKIAIGRIARSTLGVYFGIPKLCPLLAAKSIHVNISSKAGSARPSFHPKTTDKNSLRVVVIALSSSPSNSSDSMRPENSSCSGNLAHFEKPAPRISVVNSPCSRGLDLFEATTIPLFSKVSINSMDRKWIFGEAGVSIFLIRETQPPRHRASDAGTGHWTVTPCIAARRLGVAPRSEN